MSDRPAETFHFEGFGSKAIDWFAGIEQDNSKSYFQAHRQSFVDDIQEPMRDLLMEASTRYEADVKLFRPNRDVRFSRDKSPYKTATYGILRPASTGAALYAGISSRGFYAGAGYYRIASDQLDRMRIAIDDDETGSLLVTIVAKAEENGLTIEGETLKSAPRGYPKDHPRIRFLRMKDFYCGAQLPPGDALLDRRVFDFAMATWKTAGPLNQWLDTNVGPSGT